MQIAYLFFCKQTHSIFPHIRYNRFAEKRLNNMINTSVKYNTWYNLNDDNNREKRRGQNAWKKYNTLLINWFGSEDGIRINCNRCIPLAQCLQNNKQKNWINTNTHYAIIYMQCWKSFSAADKRTRNMNETKVDKRKYIKFSIHIIYDTTCCGYRVCLYEISKWFCALENMLQNSSKSKYFDAGIMYEFNEMSTL